MGSLYAATARELRKTCPVCVGALDNFNAQYAGERLDAALIKYGNDTLHLLESVNASLQAGAGGDDLERQVRGSSLVSRAAGEHGSSSALRAGLGLDDLLSDVACSSSSTPAPHTPLSSRVAVERTTALYHF